MKLKEISYRVVPRCVNFAKVIYSYVTSSISHKYISCGRPIAASIEPANYCNLKCRQCPTGLGNINKSKQLLKFEDFKLILDTMLPEVMYLNLYFQGEPMINQSLPEMVAYASQHNITTCISTNGHFLTKETASRLKQAGLGKLIVSLDGADSKSYSLYRQGGRFETVLQGIRNAVEAGLCVELQCLLLSSTENQLDEVKRLGRELGVSNIKFKTAQFYNIDPLMPANKRYSRYKEGSIVPKKPLRDRCWRIISSIVINTDGEVLPCCYDKACLHSFGNLLKQGATKDALWSILHSQKASDFKNKVFSSRRSIQICTNCTE